MHNNQLDLQRQTLQCGFKMISAAWAVDGTVVRCFFYIAALWTLNVHCDTVDRASVTSKIPFYHPRQSWSTPSAILLLEPSYACRTTCVTTLPLVLLAKILHVIAIMDLSTRNNDVESCRKDTAFHTQDIEMQQIKVPCFAHPTVSLEILGRC